MKIKPLGNPATAALFGSGQVITALSPDPGHLGDLKIDLSCKAVSTMISAMARKRWLIISDFTDREG